MSTGHGANPPQIWTDCKFRSQHCVRLYSVVCNTLHFSAPWRTPHCREEEGVHTCCGSCSLPTPPTDSLPPPNPPTDTLGLLQPPSLLRQSTAVTQDFAQLCAFALASDSPYIVLHLQVGGVHESYGSSCALQFILAHCIAKCSVCCISEVKC